MYNIIIYMQLHTMNVWKYGAYLVDIMHDHVIQSIRMLEGSMDEEI